MARPAAPAMPTAEYSSAWKTFSMSRCAMRLPIVARRSPAMTTPPGNVTATIVELGLALLEVARRLLVEHLLVVGASRLVPLAAGVPARHRRPPPSCAPAGCSAQVA